MKLSKLLTYVLPTFGALYWLWSLLGDHHLVWWTQLSVLCSLAVVSWIFGFLVYDALNQETVDSPGGKAVLVTGCDTGFGHQLAIRLDQYGEFGFEKFPGKILLKEVPLGNLVWKVSFKFS